MEAKKLPAWNTKLLSRKDKENACNFMSISCVFFSIFSTFISFPRNTYAFTSVHSTFYYSTVATTTTTTTRRRLAKSLKCGGNGKVNV